MVELRLVAGDKLELEEGCREAVRAFARMRAYFDKTVAFSVPFLVTPMPEREHLASAHHAPPFPPTEDAGEVKKLALSPREKSHQDRHADQPE